MRHGLINFVYFMGVPAQILPLGPTAQQLLRYQASPVAICISFVYTKFGGGLSGVGRVHLVCSNKKLVKANFGCRWQKRFGKSMWQQARWFDRSIQTFLRNSRVDHVSHFKVR